MGSSLQSDVKKCHTLLVSHRWITLGHSFTGIDVIGAYISKVLILVTHMVSSNQRDCCIIIFCVFHTLFREDWRGTILLAIWPRRHHWIAIRERRAHFIGYLKAEAPLFYYWVQNNASWLEYHLMVQALLGGLVVKIMSCFIGVALYEDKIS